MKKIAGSFFALLLLTSVIANAQPKPLKLKYYSYPKTVPEKYLFNAKSDYDNMLTKTLPKNYTMKEYQRYAEAMSYQKADAFLTGDIYLGWDEMESYLGDVVKKLKGETYKDKPIHPYLKRDADMNAFCIHDGTLYVNVGLIADVKSEAALAAILGHEMAHYLKNHLRTSYLTMMRANTKGNRNSNSDMILGNLHSNRQRELQADSLGAVLAGDAGYQLKEGVSNFYLILQQEIKESNKEKTANDDGVEVIQSDEDDIQNQKDDKGDKILSSHPDLKRRIRTFKKLARQNNGDNPQKYLLGEEKFKQLQNKARLEVLAILMENNNYRECAERAFTYYLFEPDNNVYVYYVMEAMRRQMLLKPTIPNEPFLTDDYKDEAYSNLDDGILANLKILISDSSRLADIKVPELLPEIIAETKADSTTVAKKTKKKKKKTDDDEDDDEKVVAEKNVKYKFTSWKQAFKYFSEIAVQREIPECYLCIGLQEEKDKKRRNEFLKKYIDAGNFKYKEFATAVMNDKLFTSLQENTKELLITGEVSFVEDHRYGYHYRRILSEEKSPGYISELNDMVTKKFPEKQIVMYDDLAKEDMAKAIRYKQVMIASTLITKGEDAEEDDADDEDTPKAKKKAKTVEDEGDDDTETKPKAKAKKTDDSDDDAEVKPKAKAKKTDDSDDDAEVKPKAKAKKTDDSDDDTEVKPKAKAKKAADDEDDIETKPKPKAKAKKADEDEFSSQLVNYCDGYENRFVPRRKEERNKKSVTKTSNRNVFMLNPDVWLLFKRDQLKSLEVLNTTSLEDKTLNLQKNVVTCCVLSSCTLFGYPFYLIYNKAINGTDRFAYQVTYYSYTPLSPAAPNYYSRELTKYKMSKSNYLSTTYSIFKDKEKSSDEKK